MLSLLFDWLTPIHLLRSVFESRRNCLWGMFCNLVWNHLFRKITHPYIAISSLWIPFLYIISLSPCLYSTRRHHHHFIGEKMRIRKPTWLAQEHLVRKWQRQGILTSKLRLTQAMGRWVIGNRKTQSVWGVSSQTNHLTASPSHLFLYHCHRQPCHLPLRWDWWLRRMKSLGWKKTRLYPVHVSLLTAAAVLFSACLEFLVLTVFLLLLNAKQTRSAVTCVYTC